MRTTRRFGVLLVLALVAGCGGTDDGATAADRSPSAAAAAGETSDEVAAEGSTESATDDPAGAQANGAATDGSLAAEPASLADEDRYLAFLDAVLAYSSGLAAADGAVEVLRSVDGYGALRWTADAPDPAQDPYDVVVTHRFVEDEWQWVYVDEAVVVDAVTEEAPTQEELAAFQSLADAVIDAVDVSGPAELEYAFKNTGIASQADFVVTAADGPASLHISVDGQQRIGRIDLWWPRS